MIRLDDLDFIAKMRWPRACVRWDVCGSIILDFGGTFPPPRGRDGSDVTLFDAPLFWFAGRSHAPTWAFDRAFQALNYLVCFDKWASLTPDPSMMPGVF